MDLGQALTRVALDGFCVVGGAIPAADVAAVRESVERATAAHGRDEARDQGATEEEWEELHEEGKLARVYCRDSIAAQQSSFIHLPCSFDYIETNFETLSHSTNT